ncbi:MAG: hypothetical protein ACP5G2_06550 [Candidatus Bipolaricaulaceae bacterium]
MTWQRSAQREFLETDREFVENVLPVGTVDGASFGLIADATRYVLVEEGGEVHIRPQVAALSELVDALAKGGQRVTPADARKAVEQFGRLWEEKIRARGRWEELVRTAREAGEIAPPPQEGETRRRSWLPWRRG